MKHIKKLKGKRYEFDDKKIFKKIFKRTPLNAVLSI